MTILDRTPPSTSFAVTFDYRCPFARNAHEHVVTALQAGADWDVRFIPFSLTQNHVGDGEVPVWDDPGKDTGIIAIQAGIVVRDRFPEQFPATHLALFAARHDQGKAIRDPEIVRSTLEQVGVDAEAVFAEIATGTPLKTVRAEHEAAVAEHTVWGVPTFIKGDQAVYIRFMHRPRGDADMARRTIERVVDLLDWSELNEFKHTSVSS